MSFCPRHSIVEYLCQRVQRDSVVHRLLRLPIDACTSDNLKHLPVQLQLNPSQKRRKKSLVGLHRCFLLFKLYKIFCCMQYFFPIIALSKLYFWKFHVSSSKQGNTAQLSVVVWVFYWLLDWISLSEWSNFSAADFIQIKPFFHKLNLLYTT